MATTTENNVAGPRRQPPANEFTLTTFNPFPDEEELDQSSYAYVTSLLSKVRNTFAPAPASKSQQVASQPAPAVNHDPPPRAIERKATLPLVTKAPAPPLVSVTPAVSQAPSFQRDLDSPVSRTGLFGFGGNDGAEGQFGTAIPGFPIADDARSIKTSTSYSRQKGVSKVIRRLRGEGLSRDYWMDDENCKECYDCKSIFTTWRRKHHCRICGQIFCARCASNIIKGSRFGQDSMIRICSICLKTLEDDTIMDDDEDDRRSVVSSAPSMYASHQYRQSLEALPQSPFSASQLFGLAEEPFNLFSIAETKPQNGSLSSTRPATPADGGSHGPWDIPIKRVAAPFRSLAEDEEADAVAMNAALSATGPVTTPANENIIFPMTEENRQSSIQFPGSSPEQPNDRPGFPRGRVESDTEIQTPFMRSRVQSRLQEIIAGDAGWRTRRESTAYAHEVNSISMFHIRLMLRQMLTTENLPNIKEWEETLLKLAMQIARDLVLATGRREMDMDVRRFVKIKRIPGGSPRDSEYVAGAVITKNLAHKQMPRHLVNPRVLFMTFPFDYNRVEGQIVAFDPLVAQEGEYLQNLVSRVSALRPHILLVEKTVSRRALDYLHNAKIAVARNVKTNALNHVARMTQGDIISSLDRLALDPKPGHCAQFRVQTFEHPLIPGKRKTYMRFEGCNRDLGCTILLRGGNIDVLTKVKKVTRFLAFLVRNLKMETFLWKDSVVTMPPLNHFAVPEPPNHFTGTSVHAGGVVTPIVAVGGNVFAALTPPLETSESMTGIEVLDEDELPDEDAAQLRLSRSIQKSIEPYYTTFISVSSTLRFPPPYPIARMKQLDDRLREVKRAWEDEVIRKEETGTTTSRHQAEPTITLPPSRLELTASPMYTPPVPEEAPSYFEHKFDPSGTQSSLASLDNSLAPSYSTTSSELVAPVHLKRPFDIALESELAMVRHQHAQAQAVWEWYLRRNKDDFVVDKYQRIAYRMYTVPFADVDVQMPCFMPYVKYVTYYGNNDCALGTFIEEVCVKYLSMKPGTLCTGKGCGKPLVSHCNVYVHNQTRLIVAIEPWAGTILGAEGASGVSSDYITTWSICRLCGKFTPFLPISPETQHYSFAKFLELHFYPADVMLIQGAGCMHNIYKDHVRYFAWKGLTVRFQSDPIVSFEPVFPSAQIFIRPDVPLQLKNHDYEHILLRNAKFWESVEQRLRWYDHSYAITVMSEKVPVDEDPISAITRGLLAKAEAAKVRITQAIHTAYSQTIITDTLAFGKIRQELQDESTVWEKEFERLDDLRRPPPPTFFDKDLRKSVAIPSRFKDMFAVVAMPGAAAPEKSATGRRPSVLETEAESTDADSVAPREREHEYESEQLTLTKSPISDPSAPKPNEKEQERGLESDSTINAIKIGSRQPSQADLKAKQATQITETETRSEATPAAQVDLLVNVETPTPPLPETPPPPEAEDADKKSLASTNVLNASRLPRRVKHSPRIARLVQQFQPLDSEFLATAIPGSGLVSESEQEPDIQFSARLSRPKARPLLNSNKNDNPLSDFEGSYAANIAPLYFAHKRPAGHTSRIPGPIASGSEGPSRKASPERPIPGRTIKFGQGFRAFEPPGSPLFTTQATNTKGKEKMMSNLSITAGKFNRRANTLGHNRVSKIAKQYENMARDPDKSRKSGSSRKRKARPVATSRVTVEVLKTVKEGFAGESESSSSSSEADDEDEGEEIVRRPKATLKPVEEKVIPEPSASTTQNDAATESEPEPEKRPGIAKEESNTSNETVELSSEKLERFIPPSPGLIAATGLERVATLPNLSENELSQPERNSVLRAFSLFQNWSARPVERGPEVIYPGSKVEHFFRESTIVVREDEPTSFIAFALDSQQHRDYLANRKRALGRPNVSSESEAFGGDEVSVAETGSNWGFVSLDDPTPKDVLKDEGPALEVRGTSPSFTFTTENFQFKCIIYLTEQFDALRAICRNEKDILGSLSRCVKWDAVGGKSGSAFLKTRDDRFIAKEISRFEGDSFGEIGPAYFSYLSQAFSTGRTTLLAKILGVYTIEYRRISTEKKGDEYVINGRKSGKTVRMDLMVMENLFHGRRFSKIYDLKGSVRGRHVNSTGRANEVLLDENLVQMTHAAPFYLREHGKRMLRGALWNDTKFLQSVNVMDYSLLVGVDDQSNELVLGIVDYIRTFTWDKRLENWMKDLGGAGKEPTIVTPKQYKQRFRSAMERYFPLIPDRWMKQEDVIDDEGKDLLQLWRDW